MSVHAMAWAELCDVRGAGSSAQALLNAIAWRAADSGDRNASKARPAVEIPDGQAACWAGVDALAAAIGRDERTVRAVLQKLESAGVILRRRRTICTGRIRQRAADAIFLNLAAGPRCVPIDPVISEKRARAGRLGAARLAQMKLGALLAEQVEEWLVATGQEARLSRQNTRFVASENQAEHPVVEMSGSLIDERAPGRRQAGSLPRDYRAMSPGNKDRGQDIRQDIPEGSSSQRARESQPVDNSIAQTRQSTIFEKVFGTPREPHLPAGGQWKRLRDLPESMYADLFDRKIGELPRDSLPPDWLLETSEAILRRHAMLLFSAMRADLNMWWTEDLPRRPRSSRRRSA